MRTLVFLVTLLFSSPLFAQQPADTPVLKQFVRDEWKIWSSPAHIRSSDAGWLSGLALGSAVLFETDRHVSQEVGETDDLTRPSHVVSSLGSIPVFVAPAAMLAIGKIAHHDEFAKTGGLGLTAVAHAAIVSQVVKQISGRQRPTTGDGLGLFRQGGSSFPSGHSMTSWAFATVLARRSNSRWVKLGSYSFAAAVSMSRVGGRNHFPSDVLIGSASGYLIGRYITRG